MFSWGNRGLEREKRGLQPGTYAPAGSESSLHRFANRGSERGSEQPRITQPLSISSGFEPRTLTSKPRHGFRQWLKCQGAARCLWGP